MAGGLVGDIASMLNERMQAQFSLEQQVLNSWGQLAKQIFVTAKVVSVCYLLMDAILSKVNKNGSHDQITIMMMANMIILLAMVFFDFGAKYIAGFYAIVFAQNYINFLGFNYLVRKLRTPERKLLRKKTNFYFLVMNLLYFTCFLMSFSSKYGPWCTDSILYPPVMNFTAVLFVFNAVFHFYMHYNKYWLQWEDHPKLKPLIGREEEQGWEPIATSRKIFEAQMQVFVQFQAVICVLLLVTEWMANYYVTPVKDSGMTGYLGCTLNGFEWIYETIEGSLFILLHMACICLQAIMLEKVFYGVPRDLGYFDGFDDDDSIFVERPSFTERKQAKIKKWQRRRLNGASVGSDSQSNDDEYRQS